MRVTRTSTTRSLGHAAVSRIEYGGVAELWWDGIDDLVPAAASEEGQTAQQALLEDERRFIDVANSPIWLGEEIVVIGEP